MVCALAGTIFFLYLCHLKFKHKQLLIDSALQQGVSHAAMLGTFDNPTYNFKFISRDEKEVIMDNGRHHDNQRYNDCTDLMQ